MTKEIINIDPQTLPAGFKCLGKRIGVRKKEGKDLMVIFSEKTCNAAAVFTRHSYPGASIILGKEHIADGLLQAVVAVSGNANVATGDEGLNNALKMCKKISDELNIDEKLVLPSSTGIIGQQLPIDIILNGIKNVKIELQDNPIQAAEAIMTTDTHPKVITKKMGDITLTGIAKGSGMIAPNMATMLVYLLTDAQIDSKILQKLLLDDVISTYNMMSIDSDTSTSDTVALLANGNAGKVDPEDFKKLLHEVNYELVEQLMRDAEGATKFFIGKVKGAKDSDFARKLAKSLIDSPLMKTMIHGGDPNIGRIVMALGKTCDNSLNIDDLNIYLNGNLALKNGMLYNFDESFLRKELMKDTIIVEAEVGKGPASAEAYGCDLTNGYIKENASYYSS